MDTKLSISKNLSEIYRTYSVHVKKPFKCGKAIN